MEASIKKCQYSNSSINSEKLSDVQPEQLKKKNRSLCELWKPWKYILRPRFQSLPMNLEKLCPNNGPNLTFTVEKKVGNLHKTGANFQT